MYKLYFEELKTSSAPWASSLLDFLRTAIRTRAIKYGASNNDQYIYLYDLADFSGICLFDEGKNPYILSLDLLAQVCADVRVLKRNLVMPVNVPFSKYTLSATQLSHISQHYLGKWFSKSRKNVVAYEIPYGYIAYHNTPRFLGTIISNNKIEALTTAQYYELFYEICRLAIMLDDKNIAIRLPSAMDLMALNNKRIFGSRVVIDGSILRVE